jgi:hypothetical protein
MHASSVKPGAASTKLVETPAKERNVFSLKVDSPLDATQITLN